MHHAAAAAANPAAGTAEPTATAMQASLQESDVSVPAAAAGMSVLHVSTPEGPAGPTASAAVPAGAVSQPPGAAVQA
jgi:hypothetical protein